ncbi:hypothetical protein G7Z17_g2558 [Cylindrodendrum hubeiense]|uniref:ABC transporter domain-containing protein n=1 Tax=Cylindrodendrum hubeiense TaxID=595255 RepID=A0A9P5LBJ8_9HYPO|nr:hypothetical protein G7Z17_g2558 [Cylindrodendrum hubeiense]
MAPDPSGKGQEANGSIYMNESLPLVESQQKFPPAGSAINILFNKVEPVKVQIRDLGVELTTEATWSKPITYLKNITSKSTNQPPKELLRFVSADFQPSLIAIIGSSGSGKTTLLDALSDRLTGRAHINQGIALFNGRPGVDNIEHAYVTQQDILLPSLTVRETLRYAADLRLPLSIARERHAIVEDVIAELGLQKCADTRIGNSQNRGCSGGEKRRVSIGVQLLANPSMLCLDEPTTGLDAASAFHLATTLRRISRKGRVVVMTIHQPRPEIWSLFDNVIVLAEGGPVYSGPTIESLPWFELNGFEKPPFINPADFIIDTAAIDYRGSKLEEESRARVNALKSAWHVETQRRFPPLSRTECSLHVPPTRKKGSRHMSQFRQVRILTNRTVKVTYRDPLGMTALVTEAILMGLAVGYMFYDLGRDEAGIRSRQGPPEPQKALPANENITSQRPIAKIRSVSVELQQFMLTLSTKTLRTIRTGPTERSILKPINAKFEPGVLNVVLGPSGSGKSSLLNAIARRLRDSIGTKYQQHGRITFNGMEPSRLAMESICSYVHQDGELLLPAMTVRETLRYAAALRLPRSMSVTERQQRADDLLLKMGLNNCADTLIGSESFRGISGGEKRRVSLAIQILRDPQVILVDEPTSGLDAFTANSIVQVLQDLAEEGRTIIMAIHQPRSDLFAYFGNILLLSQVGSPVYFGPAKDMTDYLAAI